MNRESLFSGFLIGLGATGYLALGGIPGAVIFAFGLVCVVLFGVPLFIVCGFYHSIADVTYIVAAWKWSPALLWYYPLIVLGNYVGCNVRRVTLRTS